MLEANRASLDNDNPASRGDLHQTNSLQESQFQFFNKNEVSKDSLAFVTETEYSKI